MFDIFYYEKGSVKRGDVKDLGKLKKKQLWVDVTNITKKEEDILKTVFNLHPLTIEDLLHSQTRIKVEEFPNYLFCVFYGVQEKEHIEIMELDFVLGRNFFISNHLDEIKTFSELKNNPLKLASLFKQGNDFIFHYLLDIQVDNFFPVLDHIDDRIEVIEERVTKHISSHIMKDILDMKRLIILVKRTALPQRDKLSYLRMGNYAYISKDAIPYFRDIYDHAIRVCDAIDNYREAIANTFDVYMSAVNNNTNEIMKMLSIVATIALPLTVLSSIYGTNFTNLPGKDIPNGFWIMIIMMIIISGMMFHYFYRKGWIRIVI